MAELNIVLKKQADLTQELIEKANQLKEKIEKITLDFTLKANNDKAFGAISTTQIIDMLEKNTRLKLISIWLTTKTRNLILGFISSKLNYTKVLLQSLT